MAAMSTSGIIATNMTSSTVSGDTFFDFLSGTLIPNMLPFDGLNERSVLVLDNCSVHHIEAVATLLQQAGIVTLFLPPYSPNLNPLEEVFSLVKGYFKHDTILQYSYFQMLSRRSVPVSSTHTNMLRFSKQHWAIKAP